MKFTFDGELVQQSTKCKNRRDAETVESAYRTQLALGKVGIKPQPKAPVFNKAVEDFIEWLKVEHATQQSTFKRYYFSCQVMKKYFAQVRSFGKLKVSQIETGDIEKFVAWRSVQISRKTKKVVERKSVNFDLFTLKMMFRRLFDSKVLSDDPTRTVKQLTENEPPFHVLTDVEEKAYLLACPQPIQDIAALMLETGVRPADFTI